MFIVIKALYAESSHKTSYLGSRETSGTSSNHDQVVRSGIWLRRWRRCRESIAKNCCLECNGNVESTSCEKHYDVASKRDLPWQNWTIVNTADRLDPGTRSLSKTTVRFFGLYFQLHVIIIIDRQSSITHNQPSAVSASEQAKAESYTLASLVVTSDNRQQSSSSGPRGKIEISEKFWFFSLSVCTIP